MATAKAHTNIALVKYWGKRDQQLILPQTDSLSLTLNDFYTTTTVNFDSHLVNDEVTINGNLLISQQASRVVKFLDLVREMSGQTAFAKVNSINHVPTSAGLASSASAFAALAGAASTAAGLHLTRQDLSRLARRGSGSATRSIYGGLVVWHRGHDDKSSYAEPLTEKVDFGLEMLAIMINTKKKRVSSRQGMQSSVTTSPYYPAWRDVVKKDMVAMKDAINAQDIDKIGHIAEENALRMHALTLSADPGFTYFNADTLMAIKAVQDLRNAGISCYYTMDAGPNVKVIYDRQNRQPIIKKLATIFGRDRIIATTPGPGIQIWNENN